MEKSFSYAEGADTKSFEVVLIREHEVVAILMGGAKSSHPPKGGAEILPCHDTDGGGGGRGVAMIFQEGVVLNATFQKDPPIPPPPPFLRPWRGWGLRTPRFSHFVAPPLPIINDRSLNWLDYVPPPRTSAQRSPRVSHPGLWICSTPGGFIMGRALRHAVGRK